LEALSTALVLGSFICVWLCRLSALRATAPPGRKRASGGGRSCSVWHFNLRSSARQAGGNLLRLVGLLYAARGSSESDQA